MSPRIVESAVEYSVSVAAISVLVFAMEIGLTDGMHASVIASNVFHCAGVNGSSFGKGGNGVAFGETGSVGSDIVVVYKFRRSFI